MRKELIERFLKLYENGYSEIPGVAFVKAGFADSLDQRGAAERFKELMWRPEVQSFIIKFNKRTAKVRKSELTLEEKSIYLSNVVRDSAKYQVDRGGNVVLSDPKNLIAAIKELNTMKGDYVPVKKSMELTGKDGKPLNIKNDISLDLTNLTDDELRQIDNSIED